MTNILANPLGNAPVIPIGVTRTPESIAAPHAHLELGRLIGRGATGAVYEAFDPDLERPVAIKVLLPQHQGDAAAAFLAEARTAAQVLHPHLLPLFGCTNVDGQPAYLMALISGGSLTDATQTIGRIEPRRLAMIARQVAAALDALHARGLVHRDVKPDNVLLFDAAAAQPHAFLSDFGAGISIHDAATGRATARPFGTLGFAAPEQLDGRPCDARTDVYGLGALVYWCLTGEYATPTHNGRAPVTEHRPDLDPSVELAIGKALAADSADRYLSAGAAAEAMTEPLARGTRPTLIGPSLRATVPPPPRRRWRRWGGGRRPPRRVVIGAGILATVLTAAACAGVYSLRGSHSRAVRPTGPSASASKASRSNEATLLDAVPATLRASCTPTDSMSRALVGLKCADAATNTVVLYGLYSDAATMDAWFDQITLYMPPPMPNGSCELGTAARMNWRATKSDTTPAGRLRCAVDGGRSDITWTTTDLHIFAAASSPMDLPSLWKWWQTTPGPVRA